MKKIININLSGRVTPIEDTAYESLQRYIESLRRYFAAEEGRDEIINDIESRIAELMNDKVRKGAAAVTEEDVAEIINAMGRIEDFEAADAAETTSTTEANTSFTNTTSQKRFRGRLYRDSNDKILGGVCAGIANYVDMDPTIIRLIFAVLIFGGGFGFLAYILLWIILPKRPLENYMGKRFFRNPDDRIIGGVAGGLGAYFNVKPWNIRLIFLAPLVLNVFIAMLNGIFFAFHRDVFPNFFIGSFTGTFTLAYIILWIVLPEARTTYEKMEMRGEKVDVNRIRQNVQEEMQNFKTQAKQWTAEVKETAQTWTAEAKEFANTRGKTFAAEVGQTVRPVGSRVGHVLGVIIKAFFIFIAGSIAFGLFVGLIALIFGGGLALWPMKQNILNFMLNSPGQYVAFWGTVIFFFVVPLVAFITWLVRRIMKVKTRRHYLGWIFAGLWVIGFFCLMTLIASIVNDTRRLEKVAQAMNIAQPTNGKLYVRVDEPRVNFGGDGWWMDENTGWDLTEDTLKLSTIKVRITKSEDSSYSVTVWKYGRGINKTSALNRAEKIGYHATYTDSVLHLGSGFGIDKSSKFRGQKVVVEIKVPVGKKIQFDESVVDKFNDVNVRFGVTRHRDRIYDWDDDI
ncbi:MAG: hypothetical protein C4329_15455, partial [Chitinophagaceae bacterium]